MPIADVPGCHEKVERLFRVTLLALGSMSEAEVSESSGIVWSGTVAEMVAV